MTEQEKQEIISAVLSSLRTNSKAIEQLTSVTEMLDDDQIELNGGRKVSYSVLMSAFNNLVSRDDLNALIITVNALRTTVDTKADTVVVGGVRWLKLEQWPFAALFSVEQVADSSVSNNKMYWGTNGHLKYKDNTGVVTDLGGEPRYGVLYYVDNDIYRWNGTGFTKMGSGGTSAGDIIDVLTSSETGKALSANMGRELKAQLDTRYNKTSANVDSLATKVDALIDIVGDLAALAFRGTKPTPPAKVGSFDWSVSDGGSSSTPVLTSPAAGSTVNVGQIPAGQTSVSYGILIRGSNFTGGVSLAVSGNGFSINKTSFTASEVNNGVTVFVTYTNEGTTAAQATGTLTISGGGITRTVNLSASKAADGGGGTTIYNVTQNLTGCGSSYTGATVQSGSSFSAVITPNSGYTFTGGSFAATMGGNPLNVAHNQDGSRTISVSSVTGDIVINATAVAESQTLGKPAFRRQCNITGRDENSIETTAGEEVSPNASCAEWLELPSNWDSVEIRTRVRTSGRRLCRCLCKFIDNTTGSTGISNLIESNFANTNHYWYAINDSDDNKNISFNRVVNRIDSYTEAGEIRYTITHVAFSVWDGALGDSVADSDAAYGKITINGVESYIFKGNDTTTWTEAQ